MGSLLSIISTFFPPHIQEQDIQLDYQYQYYQDILHAPQPPHSPHLE